MTLSQTVPADDGTALEGSTQDGSSRPTVYVCITCRRNGEVEEGPRPGLLLARAAAKAAKGTEVTIAPVECLGNCKRSLSAAMHAKGSWTYVFGDLDDAKDAQALIEGARLLAAAENGILPWRGRPEILKRGLIARIPPPNFTPPEETFE